MSEQKGEQWPPLLPIDVQSMDGREVLLCVDDEWWAQGSYRVDNGYAFWMLSGIRIPIETERVRFYRNAPPLPDAALSLDSLLELAERTMGPYPNHPLRAYVSRARMLRLAGAPQCELAEIVDVINRLCGIAPPH